MRRKLKENAGEAPARSAASARQSLPADWLAIAREGSGRRSSRDRDGQDELRSYQVQNRPESGEYRAIIGHKRGAIRLPGGAAASEKPGILGIRAGGRGGENVNERGDISPNDISHEMLPGDRL